VNVIAQSIDRYVKERLEKGIDPSAIRTDAIRSFTEQFALEAPDQKFVPAYNEQVTAAVDEALNRSAKS
jgi:hypothetical protein